MSENQTGPLGCPMGKMSKDPGEYLCGERNCAWWDRGRQCCAMLSIAMTLRDISGDVSTIAALQHE